MNFFNDILYFSYITEPGKELLRKAYRLNQASFMFHLNQVFDLEFRNKVLDILEMDGPRYTPEQQLIANEIYSQFARYLHEHRTSEGNAFWYNRGVTEDQILQYKLGDTGSMTPKEAFSLFYSFVSDKSLDYKELALNAATGVSDQLASAQALYGNSLCVSCPTFNSQDELKGIVFRVVHFSEKYSSAKNLFKFYNPYSYSFVFDYSVLEKYQELYLVEGVFDALALYRLGIKNVISPSMVRLSPWHVEKLKEKKVNVIFDRDYGGLAGLRHIHAVLPEKNIGSLSLLPDKRDIDELLPSEVLEYLKVLDKFDVRNLLKKSE